MSRSYDRTRSMAFSIVERFPLQLAGSCVFCAVRVLRVRAVV
jgi:hypothetical protein